VSELDIIDEKGFEIDAVRFVVRVDVLDFLNCRHLPIVWQVVNSVADMYRRVRSSRQQKGSSPAAVQLERHPGDGTKGHDGIEYPMNVAVTRYIGASPHERKDQRLIQNTRWKVYKGDGRNEMMVDMHHARLMGGDLGEDAFGVSAG
jgi:hypothetical protein